jgi:hypothetical protein
LRYKPLNYAILKRRKIDLEDFVFEIPDPGLIQKILEQLVRKKIF